MMTVTATAGTPPPQPAPIPQIRATGARINSDFETFLRMLTTQLKNQDPLNPMDSAQYAAQLAAFSSVEQQVKTNDLLTGLGSQLGIMGMADLAGWVGKEARADMPVWFAGTPVSIAATPAARADQAQLVVRDASGAVVARDPVPLNAGRFEWSGTTAAGAALPAGQYTLSLESYAQGALIATTPVESYARITEARGGPNGTVLVFTGGIEVAASKVTGLRAG